MSTFVTYTLCRCVKEREICFVQYKVPCITHIIWRWAARFDFILVKESDHKAPKALLEEPDLGQKRFKSYDMANVCWPLNSPCSFLSLPKLREKRAGHERFLVAGRTVAAVWTRSSACCEPSGRCALPPSSSPPETCQSLKGRGRVS